MRNMFVKALSLGAMALLTAGWGSAAQAQSITGSSHDLRLEITSLPGTAQICVFCHTPHNTTAPEAPLWNRNPPAQDAGGWTMYTSSTLDMTIAAAPQGVSAGRYPTDPHSRDCSRPLRGQIPGNPPNSLHGFVATSELKLAA